MDISSCTNAVLLSACAPRVLHYSASLNIVASRLKANDPDKSMTGIIILL